MNTTTNTRGVYHAAHVKAVARALQTDDAAHYAADAAHMLEDYAAALEAALSAEPAAQGEDSHVGYLVDGLDFYYPDLPRSEWPKHKSVQPLYLHPAPPAQPAERVPEGWLEDAVTWGAALNEAAWAFLEACPEKSARLFNNCKAPLRAAILKYAERVAASPAPADGEEGVR